MGRNLYKKIVLFLTIIFLTISFSTDIEKLTVHADTVQYEMVIHGTHTIDEFPATYEYDDGTLSGTLTRQDSTIRTVVREYESYSTTLTNNSYYNTSTYELSSFFSDTSNVEYYDDLASQTLNYDVPATSYFWSNLYQSYLYAHHHGYQYMEDNSTMGWMESNQYRYYPRAPLGDMTRWYFSWSNVAWPLTYYPPNDGADTSIDWNSNKYSISWDGSIQDANRNPYFTWVYYAHGYPIGFRSDTGNINRYRKPVHMTYRVSAEYGNPNCTYSANLPLYDTVVTYSGQANGGNVGPMIDVEHEGDVIIGQDLTITIDTADPDSSTLYTHVTYTSSADNNMTVHLLFDGTHTTGVRQYGVIPDILPNTVYTITGITTDPQGASDTDVHIVAVDNLDWEVDIDHTEQWKTNIQDWDDWNDRLNVTDNRYEDLFFRGEVFVAKVDTSMPVHFGRVECEMLTYGNTVTLSTTDNMHWENELWEENSIFWTSRQVTFEFTVYIGATYTDSKQVTVDVDEEFYFLIHEK